MFALLSVSFRQRVYYGGLGRVVKGGRVVTELDGKCDNSQVGPEPAEAMTFWGGLWDQPGEHNRQAEWLADVKDELKNVQQQEGFQIDVKKVKKQLRKVPNWKAQDQTKCMDIG